MYVFFLKKETDKMNEKNNKTTLKIFENQNIRTVWDSEKEDYYFSIIDIIKALTDSSRPRKYWNDLKNKLREEGSELSDKIGQLKMKSQDGKFYKTDVLDTKGILRLIQSIPSPKAEPFKLWLAKLGSERIDETFDPSKAINRAITVYKAQGFDDAWIEKRLKGILHRNKLTETWKERGINESVEYAILTNEIYKTWSGMKANEYKAYKGLRKESLRDNMNDLEILLTDIGETATRELAKKLNPIGLNQNKEIARRGGNIAKHTRDDLERELGNTVISKENNMNRIYIE